MLRAKLTEERRERTAIDVDPVKGDDPNFDLPQGLIIANILVDPEALIILGEDLGLRTESLEVATLRHHGLTDIHGEVIFLELVEDFEVLGRG